MDITENKQKHLYELVKPKIVTLLRKRGITFKRAVYAPGAKKGEAVLGKILQVIVLGECGKMQTQNHFVVKFSVENFIRDKLPIRQAYAREIFMYEEVFPVFMNIQRRVAEKFVGFPKYFGSASNTNPEYIIMNDMKYEGYRTVDRTKPLNLDHMLLAVTAYAKLHAFAFAIGATKNEKYASWEMKLAESFHSSIKDTDDITFIKTHCERALKTLNRETDAEVLYKYRYLDTYIFQHVKQAIASRKAYNFLAICHGDCSITNLMFKYEDLNTEVPTDVTLVDFQMARLGSPALDLSHLFFMCTDKELRDAHYDDLLKEYYDQLISFGLEFHIEISLPFDVLEDHMRQFSIYGLYMAITSLYTKMSSDHELPTVEDIRGIFDAEEKTAHHCFKNEDFVIRMRDILVDFHNYDYDL